MGSCYHPCQGIQSEYGLGCYRSGNLFYLYCTPYTNVYRNCCCSGQQGQQGQQCQPGQQGQQCQQGQQGQQCQQGQQGQQCQQNNIPNCDCNSLTQFQQSTRCTAKRVFF